MHWQISGVKSSILPNLIYRFNELNTFYKRLTSALVSILGTSEVKKNKERMRRCHTLQGTQDTPLNATGFLEQTQQEKDVSTETQVTSEQTMQSWQRINFNF